VVAARLGATSERADVAALCDAEVRSGLSMRGDMARVSQWVRANLGTPRIHAAFSSLRDTPIAERATRLRALARSVGVRGCPMAQTLDELAQEAIYRADMQALCSYFTFPGLDDLEDDARADALEAWIRERARSPRTSALAAALHDARSTERADLLRQVAGEVDVWSCDVAKVLEVPAVRACEPPR
jgi:hypothetical protein